jgi:hypothetical protein
MMVCVPIVAFHRLAALVVAAVVSGLSWHAATGPSGASGAKRGQVVVTRTASAATTAKPAGRTGTVGADISWPQCPKGEGMPARPSPQNPMPTRDARFAVVGLTSGPAFYVNPCLADLVAWVHAHRLRTAVYAVANLPDRPLLRRYGAHGPFRRGGFRRVRNAAWQEAALNLGWMRQNRLRSPVVWIDVEAAHIYEPWSGSHARNDAVIRTVVAAYRRAGKRVGIYTDASDWAAVTGGLRLPRIPTWVSAGPATRAAAARACSAATPSGGPPVLAQWWGPVRDHDLTCPAMHRLHRFFAPPAPTG